MANDAPYVTNIINHFTHIYLFIYTVFIYLINAEGLVLKVGL